MWRIISNVNCKVVAILAQAPPFGSGLARKASRFAVFWNSCHQTATQQNPLIFLFPPHVLALTLKGAFKHYECIGLRPVHLLVVRFKMVGHHTRLSGLATYLVASLARRHLARPSAPGIQHAAGQAWLASPLVSLVVARPGLVLPRVVPFLSLQFQIGRASCRERV